MCGLLAFSSQSQISPSILSTLFALNESRGTDSAGFFAETISQYPHISKALGPFSKSLALSFNPPPTNLFIGHTRAASVGNVSIENAHPFHFGDVIGAHNGTISNFKNLIDHYALLNNAVFNHENLNIDSKVIFAALNEFDDYRILTDIEGAAALIWRDKRNELPYLNVWRNVERPLHYGFMPNTPDMYISSEDAALVEIGCVNISDFNPFTLYQIHEGKIISSRITKM
ncbi:MAG: hypothetical protein GC193_10210 [Cryomorphaceae bacterium]|nr:hypothetical protein [Cryomorphaceae bacterium]